MIILSKFGCSYLFRKCEILLTVILEMKTYAKYLLQVKTHKIFFCIKLIVIQIKLNSYVLNISKSDMIRAIGNKKIIVNSKNFFR